MIGASNLSDIFDLIPKDKFDVSGMETLKTIDIDKVEPILAQLLEWIQDTNWPVARELMDVLPRFHSGLVPHIKAILNSDDEDWKCWTLELLEKFPIESLKPLETDIIREKQLQSWEN